MNIKKSRHPLFPFWVELPDRLWLDKDAYEEVSRWVERNNSDKIGECVFFPNDQTATMFLLRWA